MLKKQLIKFVKIAVFDMLIDLSNYDMVAMWALDCM